MKHPYILFVGDSPSKKNKDPKIPFIGTKSYSTLLQWIYYLDVDFRWCDMVNASEDFLVNQSAIELLKDQIDNGTVVVVALGRKASRYLSSKGLEGYFNAYHPSPRNRILNNQRKVNTMLRSLKEQIHTT